MSLIQTSKPIPVSRQKKTRACYNNKKQITKFALKSGDVGFNKKMIMNTINLR
jgi:hypothetical protein